MAQTGASVRAMRQRAAPWWDEFERDAFREFPAVASARPVTRTVPERTKSSARTGGALPARDGTVATPARNGVPRARPPAGNGGGSAPRVNGGGTRPRVNGGGTRPRVNGGVHAPAPTHGPHAGGRRTVRITGRGAERNLPVARPTLRRHERAGFKPDRAALWAVVLGIFLILVAATSAHAAVAVHHLAVHALSR